MKIITGIVLASLITGCASADQKMASKRDYRDAQVEAIKVQAEQRTARETADQLAEAAMWQSLADAVKANPDSASHFAIVMAVAAAKTDASGESKTAMTTIKTEQDVTALDWARVLTGPVLGTVTQVGIAALNTDLQKEISRNNTERAITESNNDTRLYDVVSAVASNRDSGSSVTYSVSDNAVVNTGEMTETNTTTATTTTTTTTSDDDIFVVGTGVNEADDTVDTVVAETYSFGLVDEVAVDDGVDEVEDVEEVEEVEEVEDEPFDCSPPLFSPVPPECI